MSVRQAKCPACGAPVQFTSGASLVVVCEFCRSLVARTDRAVTDLGKVAEIMDTGSPLAVGTEGKYKGNNFRLTGRAQLAHQAGGRWDEWYATFDNGWLGWLAEAQGRFYMTFEQPYPASQVPSFESLQPGMTLPDSPHRLTVAETGYATYTGAKGEIPYRLTPNAQYPYADLQGPNKVFATLSYGDTKSAYYLGEEVTLNDLGIKVTKKDIAADAVHVSSAQLNCPNCAGPLELRAPDQTERVTCPQCSSLLDVNQGKLKYLKTLGEQNFVPYLPLGSKGTLAEGPMTVIGAMTRSVMIEGETYYWGEYLAYEPSIGFRWLVHSDNHWSYVKPVAAADVLSQDLKAAYGGEEYKVFQDAEARVESVLGEFYWKVETGETVRATDFIAPPRFLSREVTEYTDKKGKKKGSEVNWSVGDYTPVEEIEKAFGINGLPRPSGVAPNQPNKAGGLTKYWLIFSFAVLVLAVLVTVLGGSTSKALDQTVTLQPLANPDATQVYFSDQEFYLKGRRNLYITAYSPVENGWVTMEGDLINNETGLVQSFPVEISYYKGVDGGESWSEGDRSASVYTSAVPAGNYTLRLEAVWDKWQQPITVQINVEQNRSRGRNLIWALILLAIGPLIGFVRYIMFEGRRWSESMYNSDGSAK